MFIKVYASGTNVQRLAKCSNKIDGVVYTAYSELEQAEPGIIKRKFFRTEVDSLKQQVEQLNAEVMPSWTKIWGRPLANQEFVGALFKSLVGDDCLRPELNLSAMDEEPIDCFMLLVSANNKEMSQIKEIADRAIPEYHIKVLNGDYTSNREAQHETKVEIRKAKLEGKKGVVVIANQMGSRSYSISEIQATVIAYDRGSVDATAQKTSRCLTPGKTYSGQDKVHGIIVDLSFDPNRAENIEKILIDEAVQVMRSGLADDFTSAVKYILSSANVFKMAYGNPVPVTESEMFKILGDNDNLLRVADVTVDPFVAVASGVFDILKDVKPLDKAPAEKKDIVGEGVINAIKEGGEASDRAVSDKDKRKIEDIINQAIKSLNLSATSVYFLSNGQGHSYRECLTSIAADDALVNIFKEDYCVSPNDVITLLDNRALNEPILDVVVQNCMNNLDPLF